MSKAKPIDRVEYTKQRFLARIGDVVDRGTGAEICPVCGSRILHESGCVRCPACGWSMC